jgi:hypothetical protein
MGSGDWAHGLRYSMAKPKSSNFERGLSLAAQLFSLIASGFVIWDYKKKADEKKKAAEETA